MSVVICCVLMFALCAAAIYILLQILRKEKKTNGILKKVIEEQKENLLYLARHAEELSKIEKDKNITQIQIKEAKTDEEVLDIINAIVNHNNELCDE